MFTKTAKNNKSSNNSKKLKKIILLFCSFCLILFIAGTRFKQNFQPRFVFGCSVSVIATSSMSPNFPARSLVLLKKTSFSSLKKGDIIAFKSDSVGGRVAMHRIIGKAGDGFLTKGDQNAYADAGRVTKAQYVAKCVSKKGIPIGFLYKITTPHGIVFYVLFPLIAIFAALNAKRLYGKLKKL